MKKASNIVVKILAIVLLTAAVLKGWQLLTEPVANNDIWSYRPFLILTVEFELALGIWLLSGLFKKAAWMATLLCFSVFSAITLYKAITGAESCGCFGPVHINPWIKLLAVDIPAVLVLVAFQPKGEREVALLSMRRFAMVGCTGLAVLSMSSCVSSPNNIDNISSSYKFLEPAGWVNMELPILEYIDIGEYLKQSNWLVFLYHHDCPECQNAIVKFEQLSTELEGNGDSLIAFIEVPPYGPSFVENAGSHFHGRLSDVVRWPNRAPVVRFRTPTVCLLANGIVIGAWEEEIPDYDTINRLLTVCLNNEIRP